MLLKAMLYPLHAHRLVYTTPNVQVSTNQADARHRAAQGKCTVRLGRDTLFLLPYETALNSLAAQNEQIYACKKHLLCRFTLLLGRGKAVYM